MDAGEVFLLLNRLNEDWGWGQSQRTGESGLVPLLLMDDVVRAYFCIDQIVWCFINFYYFLLIIFFPPPQTHEDSNFGKPWFHSTIGRDQAIDLLMRS